MDLREGERDLREIRREFNDVGVTDDVLAFAKNIAMHPETWLNFPLSDDEDLDDFDMSDAQQEHDLAVMNLAPELAALRMELCPEHISDGYFWKIYFVHLHSRLSKHDVEVLSTPQIVEARAMLMYQPQKKLQLEDIKEANYSQKQSANSPQVEKQSALYNAPTDTSPLETFAFEPKISMETTDTESDKQPIVIRDVQIINKTVVEELVVQNKDEVIGSSKEGLVPVKDEAVGTYEKVVVSSKDEAVGTYEKVVVSSKDEVINHSKEVEVSRKDEKVSNSKEVEVLSKDEVISDSKKEVVPKEDKVISSSKEVALQQTDEEDMDDWLEDDSAETTTFSNTPLGNDEDVSFSYLEEEDKTVKSTKIVGENSNNSKNKASDDWINVDEKDVTNQVFRYAKNAGASHINKPKMRHYVHCYALHCLDQEASNALRRAFKERGESVGAWRQACYEPLVKMAALQRHCDIDVIFENHPSLGIWYVPTKLRHLCHAQRQVTRSIAAATGTGTTSAAVVITGSRPAGPSFQYGVVTFYCIFV